MSIQNNKGQSLVLFILLLPIIIMAIVLVFDIGLTYTEKRHIDNVIVDSIEYSLDNISNEDVSVNTRNIIELNIKNISSLNISINDNMIEITLIKKVDSISSNIFNKNYEIKSDYIGYVSDNKKIIKRKRDYYGN